MLFAGQLSDEQAQFREEVRAFLAEHLDAGMDAADDAQRSMVADPERSKAWIALLRPRGWHAGHIAKEFGGAGLSPIENYILHYEMGLHGAPALPPMGLYYVAPTAIEFGTQAQRDEIVPRVLDGSDYWCQGFSEPGSGSDLASVAMFAERRGDAYFLNGSKIWTTDAQHANKIFCLVRTRRENTRDALSFMLVDMAAAGVTVRPIRLFSGDHDFNQVFFDDVEIPVEALLGEEGNGWAVAKFLLDIERGAFVFGGRLRRRFVRLCERAQNCATPLAGLWDKLAQLDIELLAYEVTELRLGHAALDRSNADAEASVVKIEWTELAQRIDELHIAISGPETLYADAAARGASTRDEGIAMPDWLAGYFNNRAASIYGGSNEVQRNLVYRALKQQRRR